MRIALLTLLLVGLSGCTGPGTASEDRVPWPETVEIETTALEPFELRGAIRMAWDQDRAGLFVESEDDMFVQYLRDGDTWYATSEGRGWLRFDEAFDASSTRAYRPLVWDVPSWAGDPAATVLETDIIYRGEASPVTLAIHRENGGFMNATVTTPLDPESPYTLHPTDESLPFPMAVPDESITPAEENEQDQVARDRHVQIVQWLRDHQEQRGSVPEEVDQNSLALQRLGTPWPVNPYDGEPMRDSDESGHFVWRWCSGSDATYIGYGWDVSPVSDTFGQGCQE